MGWTTSKYWQTRQDLIQHLTKPTDTAKPLKHCIRGSNLWVVWEVSRNLNPTPYRYIALYLLRNFGKGEGHGYKDLDESEHPFQYNCPLGYLSLVPEVSSQTWRDAVERYHKQRKESLCKHG